MARFERGSRFGTLSISLGVLVLVATAAAWLLVPTQYEAFALLKVSSRPPAVLERRPERDRRICDLQTHAGAVDPQRPGAAMGSARHARSIICR